MPLILRAHNTLHLDDPWAYAGQNLCPLICHFGGDVDRSTSLTYDFCVWACRSGPTFHRQSQYATDKFSFLLSWQHFGFGLIGLFVKREEKKKDVKHDKHGCFS